MIVGREIVRVGVVSSTMDLLAQRAVAGAGEGLLILADEQTAGRGRAGRTWNAPIGSSLLCSILLRPKIKSDRLGSLSLLVGVAVAVAIESLTPLICQLKWPNDVLLGGAKVAGILLQSRLSPNGVDFVNIGIGINLETPRSALFPGATSLLVAGGGNVTRDQVLATLCRTLDDQYARFISADGIVSLDAWRRRAAMIGQQVSVVRGQETIEGQFIGVDNDGRLLLEMERGHQIALTDGEVQRGPIVAISGNEGR